MDFIHNSLQLIEQYMLAYGYWAVFFGVMLENAGLPVPGETILLVGGYFASTHPDQFNLIRVMATAATGAVIGDNIGFAIHHRFACLCRAAGGSIAQDAVASISRLQPGRCDSLGRGDHNSRLCLWPK